MSRSAYRAAPGTSYRLGIHVGASLLEVKPVVRHVEELPLDGIERRSAKIVVAGQPQEREGGGKRAKIKGFTAASRKRLRRRFGTIRRDLLTTSLLVTLTYPQELGADINTKAHLDAFNKRLKRKYPNYAAIWKKEYQANGMPHFHLMVFGIPFLPKAWLSRAWYEVVGSGMEKHLRAGTQVQHVHTQSQAVSYLEKYINKEVLVQSEEGTGRLWGVVGQWGKLVGPFLCIEVSREQVVRLARVLDRLRLAWARRKRKGRSRAIKRAKRRRQGVLAYGCAWYTDTWAVALNLEAITGQQL